ncbi:glycosyltransferase [candidate division KSB1 bacterium]|nr:glycosyltransferase [candidate division KSB1 bacterium]
MKNEEKNVRQCLDSLINQNYPRNLLEIFIIDDGSTDKTSLILDEYNRKNTFVSVLKIDSSEPIHRGKKNALTRTIKKSNGKILLFTDADCVPQKNWVRSMTSCFDSKVGLVVGFSPLIDPSNSLFGNILKIDSLAAGIVAAGSIGLNKAVTCTGRNLAYRREVFDQINGFEKIMNSISGDDDLFLQLVKKKTNWETRYATQIESIVPSFQTKSFTGFFRQKRRHLSAGKYYNFKVQIGYFLFHLANLCFFLFLLFSVFSGKFLLISFSLFLSKLIVDWILLKAGCLIFSMVFTFSTFLFWEVFFLFYHLVIGPVSWIGKIKW